MTEEELNLERAKQQQCQRTYVEKRKREGTYEIDVTESETDLRCQAETIERI